MNTVEFLNSDYRVLAGLIGKVWSSSNDEQTDMITKANAELYIRMYLEETYLLHQSQAPGELDVTDAI